MTRLTHDQIAAFETPRTQCFIESGNGSPLRTKECVAQIIGADAETAYNNAISSSAPEKIVEIVCKPVSSNLPLYPINVDVLNFPFLHTYQYTVCTAISSNVLHYTVGATSVVIFGLTIWWFRCLLTRLCKWLRFAGAK